MATVSGLVIFLLHAPVPERCDEVFHFADSIVAAAHFFVSGIVRIVRGAVSVQLGIFVRIFGLGEMSGILFPFQ